MIDSILQKFQFHKRNIAYISVLFVPLVLYMQHRFKLSDAVIITAIGSLSAQVVTYMSKFGSNDDK